MELTTWQRNHLEAIGELEARAERQLPKLFRDLLHYHTLYSLRSIVDALDCMPRNGSHRYVEKTIREVIKALDEISATTPSATGVEA